MSVKEVRLEDRKVRQELSEAKMTPDEERAREIAAELVTDAFWRFGKKPSNKARELCVKWTDIIAQALARARREENEACLALVTAERAKLQGRWSLDSAYLSQAETALRARQTSGRGEGT